MTRRRVTREAAEGGGGARRPHLEAAEGGGRLKEAVRNVVGGDGGGRRRRPTCGSTLGIHLIGTLTIYHKYSNNKVCVTVHKFSSLITRRSSLEGVDY